MDFINMRTWMLLFLLVTHSATHAATVLSQGARNVKNGAPYGGASAIGDGVHDDTQAFLDALNIGMRSNGNATPIAPVYVPPGTYLVSKQLIIWVPGFIFGEPSNPPTIVLKSGSLTDSSNPIPFIVTLSSYNHQPYDTNWTSASTGNYASTNNTFHFDLLNINFTVQSNNAGCSDVVLWQTAQGVSFRNSIMTRNDSINNCYRQDGGGGGGIMQNLTCNGGANAALIQNTSQAFYRGCTFNGPVNCNNTYLVNFLACTFNNPGGAGLTTNITVCGIDDCTFTSGTPFHPGGSYHLENTTLPSGYAIQFTSNNIFYNGVSEAGNSTNINGVVRSSPFPNPAFPQPTSACVNVKSYGAKGDGKTDDTSAIQQAYANNNEVYFPPGNYITSKTITLSAGQKMFGVGAWAFSEISGSANPVINTTGNGTGIGVVMENISICGTTSTGSCMTWNADPASIIASVQFRQPNNTSATPPRIIFQTGGAIWDGMWSPADSASDSNQQPTCFVINCAGPMFVYSVATEHYQGPTFIINNAQNYWCLQHQFEFTSNQTLNQICQITNSSNINIHGVYGGGLTFPALINVANSTVGLFGIAITGQSNGIIKEGSNYYGGAGIFSFLDGFLDR
jgi:hypothetical protein